MTPKFAAFAILATFIFAVFGQTLTHDFVRLDDDLHLYANPAMTPPTLQKTAQYWSQPYFGLYIPVTYTIWSALAWVAYDPGHDVSQRALKPWVFHLASLVVHLANAIGVYLLLQILISAWIPSLIGAALFAVHPLQVESVAWIASFRDLLAAFFSLLATLTFLHPLTKKQKKKAERKPNPRWIAISTICFALALLSKPTAAMLPAFLALLVYWKFRKDLKTHAFVGVVWGFLALSAILRAKGIQALGIPEYPKTIVIADALSFYVKTFFAPLKLVVDYGKRPEITALGVGILGAVAIAIYFLRRKMGTAGWIPFALFLVALAPVLGVVPFTFQSFSIVADRYVYFAMIGPALWLAIALARKENRNAYAVAAILLVCLGARSAVYASSWRDDDTLFRTALATNPTSAWLNEVWGVKLMKQGRRDEALGHFEAAIKSRPNFPSVVLHYYQTLSSLGRDADAVRGLTRYIDEKPRDLLARCLLAGLLVNQRELATANRVLTHPEAKGFESEASCTAAMGVMHLFRGEYMPACKLLSRTLELDPNFPGAGYNLGVCLDQARRSVPRPN